MVPSPIELRTRVVAAVEHGDLTLGEVAEVLSVGKTFVKKMLRLQRAGEALAPRQGGGSPPQLTEADRGVRRERVAEQADVTLAECQAILAAHGRGPGSLPPMCRALHQLQLPRKKSLAASERDEKARKQLRHHAGAFAVTTYVFVDERGSHLGLTRLYGRAAPGHRVHDHVPGDRGKNVSTIGALGLDGLRPGLSVPGPIDADTLLFFVEELLVPTLNRGDIVGMDTVSIHNLDDIEDAIEAAGAGVLLLPTSSPNLHPIENCWSKVKARLRALKSRTLPDLLDALADAFATITLPDILGWFRPCGYRVAPT